MTTVGTFAGPLPAGLVQGLEWGPDGALRFTAAGPGSNYLGRVNPATRALEVKVSGFLAPEAIALATDHSYWVLSDVGNGNLYKIDAATLAVSVLSVGGGSGPSAARVAPTFDSGGRLYYADFGSGTIYRRSDPLDAGTEVALVSGVPHLEDLFVDSAGTLWGARFGSPFGGIDRLVKIDPEAGTVLAQYGGLGTPEGITEALGGLWVASRFDDSLYRFDRDTETATRVVGFLGRGYVDGDAAVAKLNGPAVITPDPAATRLSLGEIAGSPRIRTVDLEAANRFSVGMVAL